MLPASLPPRPPEAKLQQVAPQADQAQFYMEQILKKIDNDPLVNQSERNYGIAYALGYLLKRQAEQHQQLVSDRIANDEKFLAINGRLEQLETQFRLNPTSQLREDINRLRADLTDLQRNPALQADAFNNLQGRVAVLERRVNQLTANPVPAPQPAVNPLAQKVVDLETAIGNQQRCLDGVSIKIAEAISSAQKKADEDAKAKEATTAQKAKEEKNALIEAHRQKIKDEIDLSKKVTGLFLKAAGTTFTTFTIPIFFKYPMFYNSPSAMWSSMFGWVGTTFSATTAGKAAIKIIQKINNVSQLEKALGLFEKYVREGKDGYTAYTLALHHAGKK